jgi:hypothetical protein
MAENHIVHLCDGFEPGNALRTGIPADTNLFDTFRSVKGMITKFSSFSV